MSNRAVPQIFCQSRRELRARRAAAFGRTGAFTNWLYSDMQHDLIERLGFMQLAPKHAMLISHSAEDLEAHLSAGQSNVDVYRSLDEEQPLPQSGLDLIVSLGRLDSVNDLPGALVHIRNALAPGGLMIAQIIAAGSLSVLREVMLAADGDRAAARIHPQIDDRAATALLQRAGFAKQVVDTHKLSVRYSSFEQLVSDLRQQALTSVLLSRAPNVGKAGFARAKSKFDELRENDGKVSETFQILTLTAWR